MVLDSQVFFFGLDNLGREVYPEAGQEVGCFGKPQRDHQFKKRHGFRQPSLFFGLSETSLDQMLTFTEEEEGANRANGLGIFKDFLERPADQFAYGHRGRDLGYTADMFWFPNQDYRMTYLINYGTDANSSLRSVFL